MPLFGTSNTRTTNNTPSASLTSSRRSRGRGNHLKLFLQVIPLLFLAILGVVGALQIDQVREFLSNASGEPANIMINPTISYGPVTKPWKNLAQGGEMSDWTLDPIKGKVAALEPEYIRIDHIYSFYDIVQMDGGQKRYDFTKLDKVVDGILSTGAKPYISLSYMPANLSDDGTITGKPKNWADWQDLVRATIQHYSGTKGINNVIYEVWNEPDLFGGWKTYGDKNYLDLYTYAARGEKQVRNAKPYQFGGPAITALYKNWFDRLVEHTQNNGLRLDFFSWHRYDTKLDVFKRDLEDAITWRSAYPQQSSLQLHITEYGPDSKNHAGYDTNWSAAHTAASSIELAAGLDRAFVFEIEDGKDPAGQERWGRWGLLTHREFGNKTKPRYQAIRLMNRIQGDQVELLGKGSWVKALATRNGNALEVLIANFDVQGRHAETVPITFQKVGPGNYTLEQTNLAGQTQRTPVVSQEESLRVEVPMTANTVLWLRLVPDEGVTPLFTTQQTNATQGQPVAPILNETLLEGAGTSVDSNNNGAPFQLQFDVATPVSTDSADPSAPADESFINNELIPN